MKARNAERVRIKTIYLIVNGKTGKPCTEEYKWGKGLVATASRAGAERALWNDFERIAKFTIKEVAK